MIDNWLVLVGIFIALGIFVYVLGTGVEALFDYLERPDPINYDELPDATCKYFDCPIPRPHKRTEHKSWLPDNN